MKKIIASLIFVLLLLSIVYAQENIKLIERTVKNIDSEDTSNKVLLKSRQIIPDKGIPPGLKNKINARAPKNTHVLLQFDNIPTNEEKKEFCWWHTTDTSGLRESRHDAFEVDELGEKDFEIRVTVAFAQKHVAEEACNKFNQIIRDIADENS